MYGNPGQRDPPVWMEEVEDISSASHVGTTTTMLFPETTGQSGCAGRGSRLPLKPNSQYSVGWQRTGPTAGKITYFVREYDRTLGTQPKDASKIYLANSQSAEGTVKPFFLKRSQQAGSIYAYSLYDKPVSCDLRTDELGDIVNPEDKPKGVAYCSVQQLPTQGGTSG